MTSEFGRGYATCLLQFANHGARRAKYQSLDELIDDSVELWANGASDHLYELVRPRRGVPRSEWTAAKRMADRALDIGHGFRASSKSTWDEVTALLDDTNALLASLEARGHPTGTLDEAMATDEALGLKPDRGSWACPENLVPPR